MTGEGFKTFTEIFERQFISILKEKLSFFLRSLQVLLYLLKISGTFQTVTKNLERRFISDIK